MRLAGQLVALRRFLANRKEPDTRRRDAERHTGVNGAHDGELHQMGRTTLDAGADIEENRRTLRPRNGGGQRRPIDAGQHAEGGVSRHHRRAGVSGAEKRGGVTARHRFSGDPDRGAGLSSERRGGRLVDGDQVSGGDDADPARVGVHMPAQLGAQ